MAKTLVGKQWLHFIRFKALYIVFKLLSFDKKGIFSVNLEWILRAPLVAKIHKTGLVDWGHF